MLSSAGCALLGGHTCEGSELSLGFCVTGQAPAAALMHKGGMAAGDAIILTKRLGTGVRFAAQYIYTVYTVYDQALYCSYC